MVFWLTEVQIARHKTICKPRVDDRREHNELMQVDYKRLGGLVLITSLAAGINAA